MASSGTDNDSMSWEQGEESSDPSDHVEVDRKSSETVTLVNSQNDVVEKKNEEGNRINNKPYIDMEEVQKSICFQKLVGFYYILIIIIIL